MENVTERLEEFARHYDLVFEKESEEIYPNVPFLFEGESACIVAAPDMFFKMWAYLPDDYLSKRQYINAEKMLCFADPLFPTPEECCLWEIEKGEKYILDPKCISKP